MATADKTYFLNADKTKAIPAKSTKEGEDDTPDNAAYLLVREGGNISDADAEKYNIALRKETESPDDEANIVITGGVATGPGVVKGERLESAEEATESRVVPKASRK